MRNRNKSRDKKRYLEDMQIDLNRKRMEYHDENEKGNKSRILDY